MSRPPSHFRSSESGPNAPRRTLGQKGGPMRVLAVHPGCLMYSKIFLRLEPLGMELVAAAAPCLAGHDVRIIDLQLHPLEDYFRLIERMGARRGRLVLQRPRQRSWNFLHLAQEDAPEAFPRQPALRRRATVHPSSQTTFSGNQRVRSIACSRGEGEVAVVNLLEAARVTIAHSTKPRQAS